MKSVEKMMKYYLSLISTIAGIVRFPEKGQP
jgi:hypothetical protein